MPYILLQGTDITKVMQEVHVTVKVDFRNDFYTEHKIKADAMLKEMDEELCAFLNKYYDLFNSIDSEVLTNHEYNVKVGQFNY